MEHTSKNDSILKIALNLTGACIISGAIIAGVYSLTADTAAQAKVEIEKSTLKSLVATAEKYEEVAGKEGWSIAVKDGHPVAYIVPAESKGYGGAIKLLVAVGPDKKVIKYSILESKETPGLGDKAKEEPFSSQYIGKSADELDQSNPSKFDPITKSNEKGKIQAISGSTITSRAVTRAVHEAVKEVTDYLEKGGK